MTLNDKYDDDNDDDDDDDDNDDNDDNDDDNDDNDDNVKEIPSGPMPPRKKPMPPISRIFSSYSLQNCCTRSKTSFRRLSVSFNGSRVSRVRSTSMPMKSFISSSVITF